MKEVMAGVQNTQGNDYIMHCVCKLGVATSNQKLGYYHIFYDGHQGGNAAWGFLGKSLTKTHLFFRVNFNDGTKCTKNWNEWLKAVEGKPSTGFELADCDSPLVTGKEMRALCSKNMGFATFL